MTAGCFYSASTAVSLPKVEQCKWRPRQSANRLKKPTEIGRCHTKEANLGRCGPAAHGLVPWGKPGPMAPPSRTFRAIDCRRQLVENSPLFWLRSGTETEL